MGESKLELRTSVALNSSLSLHGVSIGTPYALKISAHSARKGKRCMQIRARCRAPTLVLISTRALSGFCALSGSALEAVAATARR